MQAALGIRGASGRRPTASVSPDPQPNVEWCDGSGISSNLLKSPEADKLDCTRADGPPRSRPAGWGGLLAGNITTCNHDDSLQGEVSRVDKEAPQ